MSTPETLPISPQWSGDLEELGVRIFVLPGGKMPERKSAGAVGFDVFANTIVSPTLMDESTPYLRRPLFDFRSDGSGLEGYNKVFISRKSDNPDYPWEYGLLPTKHALIGIGYCIKMPFGMFTWLTPRSGLSTKYHISLSNGPGTIDPDYNGEAGADLVNGSQEIFWICHGMRIAQIIFQWALFPNLTQVSSHDELGQSERGSGGFGSTGLK